MKQRIIRLSLPCLLLLSLASCQNTNSGRINFDLNGGSFPNNTFDASYLEGPANTKVAVDIPDPVKDGYYFVGWREKTKENNYRTINLHYDDKGNAYYVYPYGSDTFYAYFEPLETIAFDLTTAKDRNGKLIAPEKEAENFSNDILKGYATKTISSLSSLPTATGDHLTFDYWYSEYPLIKVSENNDDSKTLSHYVLDTSKEKGEYVFERQFGTDRMQFPHMDEGSLTLYAHWTEDPTATVHFNLNGVEDASFQFKDDIVDQLSTLVKGKLNIDFTATADHYYYPQDTKDKRFAGFFLNSNLEDTPFYLSSPSPVENVDIYLKWEDKIKVSLDLNGGTIPNISDTSAIDGYYLGDILGDSFRSKYTPSKEHSSFQYYECQGKEFDFSREITSDLLVDGVLNLKAIYQEDYTLNVSFDMPGGYDSAKVPSSNVFYHKKGDAIQEELNNLTNQITDSSLLFMGVYQTSGDTSSAFTSAYMPKGNLTLTLRFDYKSEAVLKTLMNTDGMNYEESTSLAQSVLCGKDAQGNPEYVTIDSFSGVQDKIQNDQGTFLFDGIYSDAEFTNQARFPYYLAPSHEEKKTMVFYRKMTKAITLTFIDADDNTKTYGTLEILPGKGVSDYETEIKTLLGENYTLYADAACTQRIKELLPKDNATIYVKLAA